MRTRAPPAPQNGLPRQLSVNAVRHRRVGVRVASSELNKWACDRPGWYPARRISWRGAWCSCGRDHARHDRVSGLLIPLQHFICTGQVADIISSINGSAVARRRWDRRNVSPAPDGLPTVSAVPTGTQLRFGDGTVATEHPRRGGYR